MTFPARGMHGCSWALRLFIKNVEFTSHFPMKRTRPVWGFLAEKINRIKRKEKEESDQPSDLFITFCLRTFAVVFKRMLQTFVHLWGVFACPCICWDSSKSEIMPGVPFTPSTSPPLLPDGCPLGAAITGSLHTDPQCKPRKIRKLMSPSAL